MFENIINFFKKLTKKDIDKTTNKDVAKERLHLVLMQDRANVSADFLELMKQEIIEVIKKYIEVDDKSIDVRLTNQVNEDGTNGAPALYANIPIINMKHTQENKENGVANTTRQEDIKKQNVETKEETENIKEDIKEKDNITAESVSSTIDDVKQEIEKLPKQIEQQTENEATLKNKIDNK